MQQVKSPSPRQIDAIVPCLRAMQFVETRAASEIPRRRHCADLCAKTLSASILPTAVAGFPNKSPAIFGRRVVGQSCKPPTKDSLSSLSSPVKTC